MNIALDRLIEGIIATLRTDVIPHVADAYARGQAVGVIDLLNNIAPRVEWARGPLQARVEARLAALGQAGRMLGNEAIANSSIDVATAGTSELEAEMSRLDGVIGDLLADLVRDAAAAGRPEALAVLKAHVHDDVTAEMKLTRKPLFAEIASGSGAKKQG